MCVFINNLETKKLKNTREKKMIAKIFYAKFDSKRINAEGWNSVYGRAVLKLTSPLKSQGEKTIYGVDTALLMGAYQLIGEIDVEDENEAFARLQNVDEAHELNNRSMSVGDVVMFEDKAVVCKRMGWSGLSNYQIAEFNKLQNSCPYTEGCECSKCIKYANKQVEAFEQEINDS